MGIRMLKRGFTETGQCERYLARQGKGAPDL
jgi:hypothetical protein